MHSGKQALVHLILHMPHACTYIRIIMYMYAHPYIISSNCPGIWDSARFLALVPGPGRPNFSPKLCPGSRLGSCTMSLLFTTVEPPLMDPLRCGQPPYNGQHKRHRLILACI